MRRGAFEDQGPLTVNQNRFLEVHAHLSNKAVLNVGLRMDIRGPLEPEALAESVADLGRRHDALRTQLRSSDGGVVQVVTSDPPPTVRTVALGASGEQVDEWCRSHVGEPFALMAEPLTRVFLSDWGTDHWTLLIVQHHVTTDAVSLKVLAEELGALYGARSEGRRAQLPPVTAQLLDFARWHNDQTHSLKRLNDTEFWAAELANADLKFHLADGGAPTLATNGTGLLRLHQVDASLVDLVEATARRARVTLFTLLLFAFVETLCIEVGQDEVVVACAFSNRTQARFERTMGQLANSVPLRLRRRPSATTHHEALLTVRNLLCRVAEHQEAPMPLILEALGGVAKDGPAAFPAVSFSFDAEPDTSLAWPGLHVQVADVPSEVSGGGLGVVAVRELDGRMSLWAELDDRLGSTFADGLLERLARQIGDVAAHLATEIATT